MYVERFDALLAFLKQPFPQMEIRGDVRDFNAAKSDNPLQLEAGVCSLVMGPGHSYNDLLNQDPLGRQVFHIIVQRSVDNLATGEEQQRASLALMDRLRTLQNHTDIPIEAAGFMVRDIVPNTSLSPDIEVIATYEVTDNG